MSKEYRNKKVGTKLVNEIENWSTSKNFKKNYLTKTTKKTSVTISTSKSRKTYYVRVRAYKTHSNGKKYYGKWSTDKRLRLNKYKAHQHFLPMCFFYKLFKNLICSFSLLYPNER